MSAVELDLMPVLDQIVVTLTEEKLASGLHLPVPMEPTGPKYAKVVAIGPGRPSEYSGETIVYPVHPLPNCAQSDPWTAAVPVRVGETILMHGGAGTKVTRNGVEFRFIQPRDVLAIAP